VDGSADVSDIAKDHPTATPGEHGSATQDLIAQAHTPGPWFVNLSDRTQILADDVRKTIICRVSGAFHLDMDKQHLLRRRSQRPRRETHLGSDLPLRPERRDRHPATFRRERKRIAEEKKKAEQHQAETAKKVTKLGLPK
jgi:hypothetical protein